MLENLSQNHKLVEVLRGGGVAVVRTDTLYGLVAQADNEAAVERVYATKGRDAGKSCIVLLAEPTDAYDFTQQLQRNVASYADTPTSFLTDAPSAPPWLLRQNNQLAYRVPVADNLRELLRRTGPLIAPSANPQGQPPARSVDEARAYFGAAVDLYIDGGTIPADMPPSRLVRVHFDGSVERLR
ncbi:MAG TPA: L-threonylcarbamoyladenylate synthase [Candidatus Saccharimonadales bacterium]